jgi:YgiT-type zinc finger domain-containing protein
MYGYKYEHCEGTVRPKKVKREAFKHKIGFVILEEIIIGVCDLCGTRYYSADILHAGGLLREQKRSPLRTYPKREVPFR